MLAIHTECQYSHISSSSCALNFGSFKQFLAYVFDTAACELKVKLYYSHLTWVRQKAVKMQQKKPEGVIKISVYNVYIGQCSLYCCFCSAVVTKQSSAVKKAKNMEERTNKRSERQREYINTVQKSKYRKILQEYLKYWMFIMVRCFNEISITNHYTT